MDRRLTLTLLALLMLVAYLPTRTAGFVYEDDNPRTALDPREDNDLRGPWQGWDIERQWWRPAPRALVNVTTRIQGWAGATAAGHHAFNVGVHGLNGLLLAALLLPLGDAVALLAVLLFWLHPINGEAVRYVSARPDLLLVTAILLTLLAATRPTVPRLIAVTLGGALAVLAKESGVVILALLPLWLWYRQTWDRRWLIPMGLWLLGGLRVAYTLLHVSARAGAAHPWGAIGLYTADAAHSWLGFVAVQSAALWRLLALVVWPVGFSIDHDLDRVPLMLAHVALLALIGAGILAWRQRDARFAALWLLGALSLRFVIPQPEYLHEQHVYAPFLGVWLALSLGAHRLITGIRTLADPHGEIYV